MSTIERAMHRARVPRIRVVDSGQQQPAETQQPAVAPEPAPRPQQAGNPQFQPLDSEAMQRHGLLVTQDKRQRLVEEFRLLKRPLIRNAFGDVAARAQAANLVMLTSAVPGEGKTFCTINLALSMARELERTVLLVDADVARPSVAKYLGLEAKRGLLDVLRPGGPDLSEVLIRTDAENLVVLPAGTPCPNATELLASSAMAELTREMAERYPDRIVLFDSPPMLATTEAPALAHHMGQVVLVVEAERAAPEMVKAALEMVDDCEIVMTLLNKLRPMPGLDQRQGYYGSYGY